MLLAFGVNGFTTMPWAFGWDAERYAELGVDAVEVCKAKLDGCRPVEQLVLFADRDRAAGAVQPLARAVFSREGRHVACRVEIFSQEAPGSPYDTGLRAEVRDNRDGLDTARRLGVSIGVETGLIRNFGAVRCHAARSRRLFRRSSFARP